MRPRRESKSTPAVSSSHSRLYLREPESSLPTRRPKTGLERKSAGPEVALSGAHLRSRQPWLVLGETLTPPRGFHLENCWLRGASPWLQRNWHG